MNYSTTITWNLASNGFDVYIALTRETGTTGETDALYGPLHWGENVAILRTLNEIGIVDHISEFVEDVKI